VRVSRFLALGLGGSAVINILMGLNTVFAVACALWMFNGYFQGVGAATSVRSLTQWFSGTERGRAYGVWSAAHSLGEGTTLIATAALVWFGSRDGSVGRWHDGAFAWIGRRVEVRETRDKIEIELDARHIVTHERAVTPLQQRITLAAHRPPRGAGIKRSDPHPEEKAIVEAAPETALYVAALKQKGRKAVVLALRQLLRLLREYPREPFLSAVREAARYGLYDLDRLERMILRRVARDYFLLLDPDTDSHD